MKAINGNSYNSLIKAVGNAPRGKRTLWPLNIQVGTQSITPLMWSIETGSMESARPIITDLLTIRANRDRCYYRIDTLFERHNEIQTLCQQARGLMPIRFDGLIWRSRIMEYGLRRLTYYVKHILVDQHGDFSMATEWLTDNRDQKIVCHPVVALVMDRLWTSVASKTFTTGSSDSSRSSSSAAPNHS